MSGNHEISITNFLNNETVSHPVVIIKGNVRRHQGPACSTASCISLSQDLIEKSLLRLVNYTFKALIELKLGSNLITISNCCCTINLNLNYAPRISTYAVLPLYIVCDGHDGSFQAPSAGKNDIKTACDRINLSVKLLQCVMSEKMFEAKLGRKTFKIEGECQVFHSKLNYMEARSMTQGQLWRCIGTELLNSVLDREERKFLAFLSCTKYRGEDYKEGFSHEEIVAITEAYVALGGGGLALFGSACFYTWPDTIAQVIDKFEDRTLVDKKNCMDDSCYRGTHGACFSTTLGSVLHELCHTFDLGHTPSGIMGRGFDDIYKMFMNDFELEHNSRTSVECEEKFGECEVQNSKVLGKCRRSNDNTFWTRSCLVLMAYHRWLNDFDHFEKRILKYDSVTRVLTSTTGLRIVELRGAENEMVVCSWTFESKVLKYSFQIPSENVDVIQRPMVLVVEDNVGNILKTSIT